MSVDPLADQPLPAHPSLEQQRKRARELLNAARAQAPDALRRFAAVLPRLGGQPPGAIPAPNLSLHEAQLVIARECGFSSWPKLKAHIDSLTTRPTFERYTDRARRVLFFSRHEASELGSASIGTEHLLLALVRDGGPVGRMLGRSGLSLEHIRKDIEGRVASGGKIALSVMIPFSAETTRILRSAAEEADRLSHRDIGIEHLLLGVLHDNRSVAASILKRKGMRLDRLREEIIGLLGMTAMGSTSRWVAASRALETESANPLFIDPFARELAGEPGFAMLSSMRSGFGPESAAAPEPYFSIRTKFLDDAMLAAVREASITQVVILAAGMDTRAFRLDWPIGLTLFEVDRDEVVDRKESVLGQLDAVPACHRRIVRADLSGPWTAAIIKAGFDPNRPAAILVEGLLPYFDEAGATQLLKAIGTIAYEGSWIGLDVVNAEMLVSPAMAVYLKKLEDLGCPWKFGVDDPERWLSDHGWTATVAMPGEPEANYGRWPYAVVPHPYAGVPRSYFVQARKVEDDATKPLRATVSGKPTQVHPTPHQPIREPGLVGGFGCADSDAPLIGVLALGGSDGGVPEYFLDLLVAEGFACLALAYFGTDGTQPTLMEVPLERVERGLRWLAAHPRVATIDGRIAVVGASKGGELALLVATTFPDLVGPVVAYAPSSVAWAGMDFSGARGRSSWRYAGKTVPYVPYPEGVSASTSERGFSVLPIYDRGLDNLAAVQEATLAVERATGPLLLVSGGDDRVWPAERMCRMVVERMRQHGRADDVVHLNYPDAGHSLFPYRGPTGGAARPSMPFDLGGSPEADASAHASAWKQVVAHLRGTRTRFAFS